MTAPGGGGERPVWTAARAGIDELLARRPRSRALDAGVSASASARLADERVRLRGFVDEARARLVAHSTALAGTSDGELRARLAPSARRLIGGLSDAHVDLALNHAAGADWAASARDAREAIKLRSAAAELGGRPLKASASAHGVLANATFMLEGNTPALRAELGRVLAEEVASPGLRALLANLHVMARDFEAARAALGDARPAEAGLINTLGKLVGVRGGEAWEKHPCNFYTYRYSLVASPRIQEIVAELRALDAPAIESFGIHRDDVDIARAVAIDCLGCHDAWNRGNAAFERGNYRQAALFYVDASQAIRKFFFVHRGVANPSQLITPGAIWRHRDKEVHAPRWLITHFGHRRVRRCRSAACRLGDQAARPRSPAGVRRPTPTSTEGGR